MGIENIGLLFPGDDWVADFTVTDIGGGQFSITGSDEAVHMTDATHFQLNSPHVEVFEDGSYSASSG